MRSATGRCAAAQAPAMRGVGTRFTLLAIAAPALAAALGCAPVQPQGASSTAQPGTPPPAAGPAQAHGGSTSASRHGVPVGNTVIANGTEPSVVDSGPSPDALAVLATIPEPLTPGERGPAPASGATASGRSGGTSTGTTAGAHSAASGSHAAAGAGAAGGAAAGAGGSAAGTGAAKGASAGGASSGAATGASASGASTSAATGASAGAAGAGAAAGTGSGAGAAGAAAVAGAATIAGGARPDSAAGVGSDSAATSAEADTLVPVPAPTQPLGEAPGTLAKALADTTPPPPPPPPSRPPAKAEPDSCWHIQVAAPTEKKEADLKREAAESVLLDKFEIVHEKQRYKVRSRDCLTREAADRLRRRALQSGFEGAFPVVEVKK